MLTGLLWFDNSLLPVAQKIQRAEDYYRRKYGRAPELCLAHPQTLGSETGSPGAEDGLTVRPWRNLPMGHFWIGVEESPVEEGA